MIRALVDFAVRRRVTILMTTLAVLAFGFVGYSRLAVNLLPDISYPSLTVQTEFPDAAPAEVENLITRPVEEVVGVLKGLQSMHSVSRAGVSEVTLEFAWDTDMDMLSLDVREKLDRLVLPEEALDPVVLRFDPSLDPIARLALSGGDDLFAMRYMADKRLKQQLETVPGIAAAQVKGGLEEEIQIDLDQGKLAALGISLQRIADVVQASNINLPGGALRDLQTQYLVRTLNEYEDIDEIGRLIVSMQPGGAPVYLRDVATIRRGHKERTEIARVGGAECVELAIFKEGDSNTVEVARRLRARLEDLRRDLPAGHKLDVLFDQSGFIEQSIADVRSAALIGGGLAILILLLFLRNIASALIIATSIPVSIIATFMIMYRMDVSLNIMSLGGLTLGVGMLVDNSIVVLESIFRARQRGLSLMDAAIEGTTEVGGAVFASTLTTVCVFVPILFVEGVAGQLFKDQALTVTISLLVSLVVALTLIPMLSSLGRRRRREAAAAADEDEAAGASGAGTGASKRALSAAQQGVLPETLGAFSRFYGHLLRGAIRMRWATLALGVVLFVLSLRVLPHLGAELVPQLDQGEYYFEVTMPEGVSLPATDRAVRTLEKAAEQLEPMPVRLYYATVGSRQVAGGLSLRTRDENLGQLNLVFEDGTSQETRLAALQKMRDAAAAEPDMRTKLGTPSYLSLRTPVEIVLFGENLEQMRDYAETLLPRLRQVDGLADLRSSAELGNPELQVIFDRQRLASLDLDMAQLSQTLHDRVQGTVPTLYKEADRQIDIRVRNREADRNTLEDIRSLVVTEREGVPIRLASVAEVRMARGPAEIHRLQQQRAAVITGSLEGRSLGGVIDDIQSVLHANPPPVGTSIELGGQNEEMEVSFGSLRFALALAVFLVYLVMAGTFESLVHPLVILFTIPLALVGVVIGLGITGTPISVIVLIGAILLAGIVVNNAIVLVDAINQGRRMGLDKVDAVVRAGHLRLRPILMTTLTTVLGLVPMALTFGDGSELRAPLAITVAFGLSMATLLTLLVIPAAYVAVPSRVEVEGEAEERGRVPRLTEAPHGAD
jgi:HAE1 family hydrophobic/amphiphilic exporter-1